MLSVFIGPCLGEVQYNSLNSKLIRQDDYIRIRRSSNLPFLCLPPLCQTFYHISHFNIYGHNSVYSHAKHL